MKFIKEGVKQLPQNDGLFGAYKLIEQCARVCYKSEKDIKDSIKTDSNTNNNIVFDNSLNQYYLKDEIYNSISFVNRLVMNNHTAMLEHGTIYLKVPLNIFHFSALKHLYNIYRKNRCWCRYRVDVHYIYFSTNFRVLFNYFLNNSSKEQNKIFCEVNKSLLKYWFAEVFKYSLEGFQAFNSKITNNTIKFIKNNNEHLKNNKDFKAVLKLFKLLRYISPRTNHFEARHTMLITTNIITTRDLLRHRLYSFANESTRYCNYNKYKFGSEIQFILPLRFWVYVSIIDEVLQYIKDNELHLSNLEDFMQFDKRFKDRYEIDEEFSVFLAACQECEENYKFVASEGGAPQVASEYLVGAVKSDIVMTGFESDWDNWFELRYFEKTGKVRPNLHVLSSDIYKLLKD